MKEKRIGEAPSGLGSVHLLRTNAVGFFLKYNTIKMNKHWIILISLWTLSLSACHSQQKITETMKPWTYPFEVKYVTINDTTKIAYVDEGKGKQTFLFIHGLGSNLQAWKKNIAVLQNDFRCIAIDLPGYGKSSQRGYPFTMSFFADKVHAVVESLELENVVLVGHSMGGQIAAHLAARTPAYLDRLVLMAPAGFEIFTPEQQLFFTTFVTPAILKSTGEEQIRKNFELNFYSFPADAEFMITDRLALRATPQYDHYCAMIPQCVQGMLNEPILDLLPKISTPVLVLFGKNDQLIPNTYLHPELTPELVAREGVKAIPNAQLVLLDEAGHFVQWDQSGLVNDQLNGFAVKK